MNCCIEWCESKSYARGYCIKHYNRFKRHGDANHIEFHKMTDSLEYSSWSCMKGRCLNKNDTSYKNYGGRGITVCDSWINSFKNFYNDMGNKPFKNAQIDRIDNNGNYEPSNCRWVTPQENSCNSRCAKLTESDVKSIRSEYNGKNRVMLSKKYNVSYSTITFVVKNKTWKHLLPNFTQ